MDSGLGSDEEQRRSRTTKEQKQRLNERLLNGAAGGGRCFIDASSLRDEDCDDDVPADEIRRRRSEERRQGALLFQTSIPQFGTVLQDSASGGCDPDTPFNSIVHIDEKDENASKPSLGFYVDLSEINVESSVSASASTTKNIFSMVIDFEAPKKDMPSRLLRNRFKAAKESSLEEPVARTQVSPPRHTAKVQMNGNKEVVETESDRDTPTKFVKLSDLMHQKPKVETEVCNDFCTSRMSKSIPESSWVESPLMMSRSAGYRVAPRPLEPDSSLSDSGASQTAPSQRRLGTDLLRMFLEELDTDTALHVGARTINAHRCILISRCQYFAGTLRGRSLTLDGFSYDAVHFALCHIYSGAAHVPGSISLVELASLADMLGLEGLKEVVAHALKSRHCHNFHAPCAGCLTGVLEVLPLSSAYGLDELYQRCLRWLTAHYMRVWPTRAFASLPKELRDKCFQQHVVHMAPETVLESSLGCDQLLVSLPSLKWAEPVVLLGVQLAAACVQFVTQHYPLVLPSLVAIEPWNVSRVDEIMINAAHGLTLEQECNAYVRCHGLFDKNKTRMNHALNELLLKLMSHFEKKLSQKAHKLQKCQGYLRMDSRLRAHLKKVCKVESSPTLSRLPRMIASTKTTSSSDSSRNSSPATSQTLASPSLRRSLLLAAKAPQIPPSPAAARRSTLTAPTQASAAKSAPSRFIRNPAPFQARSNQKRPATTTTTTTAGRTSNSLTTSSTSATSNTSARSARPATNVTGPTRSTNVTAPTRLTNVAAPTRSTNVTAPTRSTSVAAPTRSTNVTAPTRLTNVTAPTRSTTVSSNRSGLSKSTQSSPTVQPKVNSKTAKLKDVDHPRQQSKPKPVERSSTFLKDEPTVLKQPPAVKTKTSKRP